MNKDKNQNITGESNAFETSSNIPSLENNPVYTELFGKKNEINSKSRYLSIVPQIPNSMGIKKPVVLTVLFNKPAKKPIIVRIKQFNPKGPELKKSIIIPEKNPVVSPKKLPLCNEI